MAPVVDVDGVDIGLTPLVVGVLDAVRAEQDRLAVGRPLDAVVMPVAVGQLARRAASRRHHEHMPVGVIVEALAVLAVVEPFHDAGRFDPAGAIGRLRQLDVPDVLRLDVHREAQLGPVGRPGDAGGRFFDARDLGDGAFRVHVADEDLRAARFGVGGVGDAIAGRRPARAAAAHEEAVLGAVGVHDPQRRLAPVGLLVDELARVDDLRSVRRNLWIGYRLVLEIHVERQAVRRRLRGNQRRQARKRKGQEHPLHRETSQGENGPILVFRGTKVPCYVTGGREGTCRTGLWSRDQERLHAVSLAAGRGYRADA